MANKSFRIRTNINQDKVVRVNLTQDYDLFEILSLKINQEDAYKLNVSNYGIIVGRVLANDAFGIPNAKVSVFIEISDDDKRNSEITNIYPYANILSKDDKNIRYNLLPDSSNDDCYRIVGTFPNKRLVLDNETEIEVYDKYWKYTTVTNKAGDYMIFGVPTGTQQVHVDIDLSDIGVLSQKPRDFMYKGYNVTQFDNSSQFKESTNLDNLAQIISQNTSVHVYPFWGDSNAGEIAISRCDIQVQYKFEPTCVFMGSLVTDNFSNAIGHTCSPSKMSGYNRNLVAGEGTIELIRKTPDNLVEEYQIQGNKLIDGDGVWCYQIPMNLDYIGTDEFGNIIPTDNPKKGIATRTSVRFRFSIQETGYEGVGRHRAKYLVPNNPTILEDEQEVKIENGKKFNQCYEFGSATPSEYYRDLYWNKVYSVKNYIPRIQTSKSKNSRNYSALRTTNYHDSKNIIPFNHGRYRLSFNYKLICIISLIVSYIICVYNTFISLLDEICIPLGFTKLCLFHFSCMQFPLDLSEDSSSADEFFPCCRGNALKKYTKCSTPGCTKQRSIGNLMDRVQQNLAQEFETANLDFYNDWLNGCLYFPLWFWKKTKKKKFLFGLFSKKAVNTYCSCDVKYKKLVLTQNCNYEINKETYKATDRGRLNVSDFHTRHSRFKLNNGVIKEFKNKAGLNIYYYAPGNPYDYEMNYYEKDDAVNFIRLYATDIILLGSLNSCDYDNIPKLYTMLPSTTANNPYLAAIIDSVDGVGDDEDVDENRGVVEVSGMDWLRKGNKDNPKFVKGMLFDLGCTKVTTKFKSCINVGRLCELGVNYDAYKEDTVAKGGVLVKNIYEADGMITRYEIEDSEARAMFASLNHNGLTEKVHSETTGYDTYKLKYMYPNDFDGHLSGVSESYTSTMKFKTYDNKNQEYIDFRMGKTNGKTKYHYYIDGRTSMPLFNNSFFFYFGLNEGSTAIDKFNSKFYAECYKNHKEPFYISSTYEAAKWCLRSGENFYGTDYASVEIKLDRIKTPYSYKLLSDDNEILISESGMSATDLKFGYKISDKGGSYVKDNLNNLIKDGRLAYFLSGKYVLDKNGKNIMLENGLYKLEIVDANGKSITHAINIEQTQLSVTYESIDLGTKYYSNVTQMQEICDENEFNGNITIKKINIDGKPYSLLSESFTELPSDGETINFKIKLKNKDNDIQFVILSFSPQNISLTDSNGNIDSVLVNDCLCNSYVKRYEMISVGNGGEANLVFNVWRPGEYKVTVTQLCYGENGTPNDNTSSNIIEIMNGNPFNVFVNDVPMKFIVGNNYKNKAFYIDRTSSPNKSWFNLHNEKTYGFYEINVLNKDIWGDFVNFTTITDENDKDSVDDETKMACLDYKFKSMFNMCRTCYVDTFGSQEMSFTSSGGKSPILNRGHYPLYSEMSDTYTPNNTFSEFVVDSLGYTACNQIFPTIVGGNYTYIDSNTNTPTNMLNKIGDNSYNKLFNDYKKIGNYFSSFTVNGGIDVDEDGCKNNPQKKYQSVPKFTDTLIDMGLCPGDELSVDSVEDIIFHGSIQKNPYFRGQFVDRRLDYELFIITPYGGDDLSFITQDEYDDKGGKIVWDKGRFSGTTYNGVEMSFDKYDNIISPPKGNENLEYTYEVGSGDNDSVTKYIGNNPSSFLNKNFYKNTLKCGSSKINANDCYWANDSIGGLRSPRNYPNTNKSSIISDGDLNVDGVLKYNGKHFNFDHRGENDLYNGDFGHGIDGGSEFSYCTKRLYDIGNIPSCSKLNYKVSSCSYDIQTNLNENGDITATTQEGETVEFDIDCRSSVKLTKNTLTEAITENFYNVMFKPQEREGSSDVLFSSKQLKCRFTLKEDSYNNTHRTLSHIPKLLCLKKYHGKDNVLRDIKLSKNRDKIDDIINKGRKISYDLTNTNNVVETSEKINYGHDSKNNPHPYFKYGNDNKLVFDDTNDAKNILYSVDTSVSNMDVVGIFINRDYFNNSYDNLTKKITTYRFDTIIDVRDINIMCLKSGTETIDSIERPLPPEPESGNTEQSRATESGQTSVIETKKAQVTEYRLYCDSTNADFSQLFDDVSTIYAALVVYPNIRSKGVTRDVTIKPFKDGKIKGIDFEFKWTGELANIFIDEDNRDRNCKLYVKMSNDFIYSFDFKACVGGTIKEKQWSIEDLK